VARGGVVRDPAVHRDVLRALRASAIELGLVPVALAASPLLGPAGNREFLMELRRSGEPFDDARLERALGEERPA
jgi:23S rRNA (cytidine1920-2'-O)/16S rRNA (cytidine1409-2'-O)-methyltransferase